MLIASGTSRPRLLMLLLATCSSYAQTWSLKYHEDFSTPLMDGDANWTLETYNEPFDDIMDDAGKWYENDYGPAFYKALNSFHTYRKEFQFGQDGWLTASLSGRDWNKSGEIDDPPSLTIEALNSITNVNVLVMKVPDHTGGVLLRPTRALPQVYRIEYKLMMLDFGGKRGGSLEYNGRTNGYNNSGCKTQHPWGEGSNSRGWSGDASVPYCEWQDVRRGTYGYNGFHFLSIVDFADPAPRNNHFWHYRRKVLMDSFAQHPDRIGDGSGGKVCNAATNEYYDFKDSNFTTVNMWISGLPKWKPGNGGLTGNSQWFLTDCSGGVAIRELQSAGELLPELMPQEYYTFAIERNQTGYTLEASGNFARVGERTFRFHRPFIVDNVPIWHYNSQPEEYNGQYNNDLVQENFDYGSMTWKDQWPNGSAYPDYFVIGDVYTNVYEGKASLTDIRLFEPQQPTVPPTAVPTVSPSLSNFPSTFLPHQTLTGEPSFMPSSSLPSFQPTSLPSQNPTDAPSFMPSNTPSHSPLAMSSESPSSAPTIFSPSYPPISQPSVGATTSGGKAMNPLITALRVGGLFLCIAIQMYYE